MSARDKFIGQDELLTPYGLYVNLYEQDIVVDMSETWNLASNQRECKTKNLEYAKFESKEKWLRI